MINISNNRKTLLFSCLLIISFSNILTAIDIGAYLSPKLLFNVSDYQIKKEKNNFHNLYMGGGLALGYNFDIFNKYSTVRIEFEYLYRNPSPENAYINDICSIHSHSFLFGLYYDYNFWYVNYNENDSIRSKLNNGKRPLMSVYAGILIGTSLNTHIIDTKFDYYGIVKNNTYYNKIDFLFGFGLGTAFHITPLISIDISYRLILNIKAKILNDFIASLRFNF